MGMCNPLQMIFFINGIIKNNSFVSKQDLAMSKKINFLLVFSQPSIGRSQLGWLNQY